MSRAGGLGRAASAYAALALAVLSALAACDRGSEEAGAQRADQGADQAGDQTVVARTAEADLPAWLATTDGTDPARWLAGREAGHPLPAGAEPVRAMQATLAGAKDGFIEDPRMIANRTVQLGQMLAEVGKREGYGALIGGFGSVAARRGRHKSLYGEMCQHYFNTRNQGLGHEAALAELAAHVAPPLAGRAP